MTIDSPQPLAPPPPVPRKPNNVDRLEIPLSRQGRGRDGLPEDTHYIDRGCGDGCTRSLECPYPRCRYDEPLLSRRQKLMPRDRAIVAARNDEGLSIADIAERFNVATRTVFRVLRSARNRVDSPSDNK